MSEKSKSIEMISSIFKFIPFLKSIAEYLKIIESVESKLNKSSNMFFNVALKYLKNAHILKKDNKKLYFLLAIDNFYKAQDLEDQTINNIERLGTIYYGLAICYYQLSEFSLAIETLNEYADINLKASFSQKTIVRGRTLFIVVPSLFVIAPFYKLNEFKRIKILNNLFNKINESIPYGLKRKEDFVLDSQKKATNFAQEIEKNMNQNIFQKNLSKKESMLLEKLLEYFNNVNKL